MNPTVREALITGLLAEGFPDEQVARDQITALDDGRFQLLTLTVREMLTQITTGDTQAAITLATTRHFEWLHDWAVVAGQRWEEAARARIDEDREILADTASATVSNRTNE